MATNLEQIRQFLDTRRVRYFLHPDDTALMVPYRLTQRLSVKLVIRLENAGRFLSIHCGDLPVVEASHPMIGEVQQALLAMNMTKRFVKFSQDPTDGEITVTGEAWIEDMDLTQVAFDRLMMNFLGCLREGGEAIEAVLNGLGMPQSEMQLFGQPSDESAQAEWPLEEGGEPRNDDGEAGDQRRDAA